MADQLTDGQQPATAASTAAATFATFDQLLESLHDIESLAAGGDLDLMEAILGSRKFLVEPCEFWDELPLHMSDFSFRLPPHNYDGEVLTFKSTMDSFHDELAKELGWCLYRQLSTLSKKNESFSKYLDENDFDPTLLPALPVWTRTEERLEKRYPDFGLTLDSRACLVGEVC